MYSHLFMLLFPTVVLALGPTFDRSYGELLALATPGFIAFGVCALPAGRLGDRWSGFGMMVVFFMGTGAAAMLTGLARSPFEIAAGLTLIGVFASIYHPVGIAWVVRHSVNQGRALGINGLFGNWGIAGAALVAGAFIEMVSWRAAFMVPGAICIATGVAFLLFARSGAVAVSGADRVVHAPRPRRVLIRAFTVLAATSLFGGLVFQASTVGMPKMFDERLGALVGGVLGVGGMVALVYFIAGFAQIIVGHLIDRYPLKPVYMAVYSIQVPLLWAAAHLFNAPLMLVVAVFAFFNVGALPIADVVVARYAPPDWRSTIYGVKFAIGLGIASLGVPMVAFIHDSHGGFVVLFTLLSGFAVVVALAAAFLPGERAYTKGQ